MWAGITLKKQFQSSPDEVSIPVRIQATILG